MSQIDFRSTLLARNVSFHFKGHFMVRFFFFFVNAATDGRQVTAVLHQVTNILGSFRLSWSFSGSESASASVNSKSAFWINTNVSASLHFYPHWIILLCINLGKCSALHKAITELGGILQRREVSVALQLAPQ